MSSLNPLGLLRKSHWLTSRWLLVTFGMLAAAMIMYAVGISVGRSFGYYDAEAAGYQARGTVETAQRLEACFARSEKSGIERCVDQVISQSREDRRSELDLSAQRQMADWAFWLLLFTLGQSIVGAFGFIALLITIRQGREANAISRRAAHAQLRAYLSIAKVTIKEPEWSDDSKTTSQSDILIDVANNGDTPAKVTSVYVTCHYFASEVSKLLEFRKDISFSVDKGPAISVPLQIDTSSEILNEAGQIFVFGKINYKDVFEESQIEMFCFHSDIEDSFNDANFSLILDRFSPETYIQTFQHVFETE